MNANENKKERFVSPLLQKPKEEEMATPFIMEQPKRRLEDLVLPKQTRLQINSLIKKVKQQESLYETWKNI